MSFEVSTQYVNAYKMPANFSLQELSFLEQDNESPLGKFCMYFYF